MQPGQHQAVSQAARQEEQPSASSQPPAESAAASQHTPDWLAVAGWRWLAGWWWGRGCGVWLLHGSGWLAGWLASSAPSCVTQKTYQKPHIKQALKMSKEDGKSDDDGRNASSIVRDATSTKERRSTGKNSLYFCCGCNYEKDVIQPSVKAATANQNRTNQKQAISAASPLKARGSITTQTPTGGIAPQSFPPPASVEMVDYLKSCGFPIGLCKSMVIHAKSIPWRIVLVDCR